MPAALENLIDNYHSRILWGLNDFELARQDFNAAGSWLSAGDTATAGAFLQAAASHMYYGILDLSTAYPWPQTGYYRYNMLYWINDNWPSGTDVTMESILSAMVAATPEELTHFIGLVDAYRVALWNAPFNAEFYAALARGFQQWP